MPRHDLPSRIVHAQRYSVERQGWIVTCPACGHEWTEGGIQMHGNIAIITQPVQVATSCWKCDVLLTVIVQLGEVAL